MAVKIFTVSSFAQVYAALKQAEGHFFASVAYDDDTTPTMIVCKDAEDNTVMTVGSNRQISGIIGYFADNTSGAVLNASSQIDTVGICAAGVYLGTVTSGVFAAKDVYGAYAFAACSGLNSSNKPKTYSHESYTLCKEYDIPPTADDQSVLAYLPIPKGENDYNYFPDLFYAAAKQLVSTGAQIVTIGDTQYITVCGRAFLRDAGGTS